MSTTERVVDAGFLKRLVIVNASVPALLLLWDAFHHQLGVNEINFAIRTTGLVGLVLLVLSLAITPLRRWTGWAPLIAARRNLGVIGFGYLLAHFLIFFVFDQGASVGNTLHEIVERVYLWFGTAALVLMLPLAITSTDGMVSRLGARRWKRLHRLAYPIAICGIIHYYLLVKSDIRQPLVFAIAIGALLLYRVVQHELDLRRELRALVQKQTAAPRKRTHWAGELKIARIFDETPDIKTFRLVAPDGGPLPFEFAAGQYLNLALTIDGKRVNRSYTIASSPSRRDYCEISVKRASLGSRHLHDTWREGQLVTVRAPAGKFVLAPDASRAVLIAGGVGITPMMSTIRSLTDRGWPGQIDLLYSVRTLRDVAFADELTYLQSRHPNLHVRITLTGDPEADWSGERGQIDRAMIARLVPGLTRGPVLVCGPEPMMTAMRRVLVDELGLPDSEVLQEAFVSPAGDAEVSPAQGAEAIAVVAADPDAPATIQFARAGRTCETVGLTVLEAAEDAGVAIPFECRSGICGQCKTKLLSGRVAMDATDALTARDRGQRVILACQARPVGDVVVDA